MRDMNRLKRMRFGNHHFVCSSRGSWEARVMYREIFRTQVYNKHGIALHPGATVVDIGANIGIFAWYAAELWGAKVHCFEPVPTTFQCLEANCGNNPNIALHPFGVAIKTETRDIWYFSRAPGNSSLLLQEKILELKNMTDSFRFPAMRWSARKFVDWVLAERQCFSCPFVSLDEALGRANIEHVDLLKVDVEGAEMQVFAGASDRCLARVRQIAAEISPGQKQHLPSLIARLNKNGLRTTFVDSMLPHSDPWHDAYPCMLYALRE